jgi:hypothetical protein
MTRNDHFQPTYIFEHLLVLSTMFQVELLRLLQFADLNPDLTPLEALGST